MQTQLQAVWEQEPWIYLEAQPLVRADWQAAFLWYLKIDLVKLAALLFLVQVQDPHVRELAAREEQELRKAPNVILALLPSYAGRAPGQEPPCTGSSGREGSSLSSIHSPRVRQKLCRGEDAGIFRTWYYSFYSICS